ncbi:hypothetical protein BSKO_02082 [Bryopsis sp. KO-2023]|nr:hypothetical protein BSKO_02082 [Bryopsis sp. KO-2023]
MWSVRFRRSPLVPAAAAIFGCISVGLVFFRPVGNMSRTASTRFNYAARETREVADVIKFRFIASAEGEDVVLSFDRVVRLWQEDPTFVDFFSNVLSSVPFAAYFWENPPVNVKTVSQPYEFIVKDSPHLASIHANYEPFSEHLDGGCSTNNVQSVMNLGRDALLVIPCMNGKPDVYSHLGNFLRRGPREQIHNFWRVVGTSVENRLNEMKEKPIWVSTSGLGVYWLHVRLDSVPKYYTYRPYAVRRPMEEL